jgi:glutaredoxin
MKSEKIEINQYKWAGNWGPFKIKIPCGECAVTENIINDVIENDFLEQKDLLKFEVKEWLPNWWKLLLRGGWHAPIVTINKKVIFQGQAIDRGFLASEIRKEIVKFTKIPNNKIIIYSKENCKYCKLAKELLQKNNLKYTEKNIVKNPLFTAELFYLTKQFFPKNKPVTTPQIWINGKYIGGAEDLEKYLKQK